MLLVSALLFLLLACHPFITYPLSLYAYRRICGVQPRAFEGSARRPSMAILVPAYNEERVIAAKLANLFALQKTVERCEILIYVDAATDRTAQIIAPFSDRVTLVIGDERRGKSYGLNRLVALTSADILVFTDANVMLENEALLRIAAPFADPSVGCVCGHLRYQNGEDSATASSGDLYWRIEERIRQLESDTIGIVGADGSLFAIRRDLHVPVPPDIIDDFYVSMRILLKGFRVVRAADALAFERTGSSPSEEFGRKVRIACQAFNVHRLIWRDVRKATPGIVYGYLSHRLLKWLIGYNLAVTGILALLWLGDSTSFPIAFTLAGIASTLFMAGVVAGIKPFPQVHSALMAFLAVAWGVFRSFRGDRFQTWTLVNTARGAAVQSAELTLDTERKP